MLHRFRFAMDHLLWTQDGLNTIYKSAQWVAIVFALVGACAAGLAFWASNRRDALQDMELRQLQEKDRQEKEQLHQQSQELRKDLQQARRRQDEIEFRVTGGHIRI